MALTKFLPYFAVTLAVGLGATMASDLEITTEIYATWSDASTKPIELAFPTCPLYVGRDAPGSSEPALRIYRVGQGGVSVEDFGDAIIDPDAVLVDSAGTFCATPGSVLTGGWNSSADTGTIWCIDPDGTTAALWGPTAVFHNPSSMILDNNGRLLFTDKDDGKVFSSDGTFPTVLIPAVSQANGIAVDAANNIYVRDYGGTIRKYDENGGLLDGSFVTGLDTVSALALTFGFGGLWGTDLYTVSNGNLLRIGDAGAVTTVSGGFGAANSIAFGPDGALYAAKGADGLGDDAILRATMTDGGSLRLWIYATWSDPSTKPIELAFPTCPLYVGRDAPGSSEPSLSIYRVGQGGVSVEDFGDAVIDPDAVTVDSAGTFCGTPGSVLTGGWNFSANTGTVWCIDPDGTTTVLWGPTTAFHNPSSMILDNNGRLLFTDKDDGKVFSSDGSFPTVLIPAAGQANGIAVDAANNIYVRDYGGTIQKYDENGGLLDSSFVTGLDTVSALTLTFGFGGLWGTDLYTVSNGNLLRIDDTGAVTTLSVEFAGTISIAFGPDGTLYASKDIGGSEDTIFSARLQWTNCSPDPLVAASDPDGNRYVSFEAPASTTFCGLEAIRVKFLNLDGFALPDPDYLWVGDPFQAPDEDQTQPGLMFTAAPLSCSPVFRDWSHDGVISVYGGEIVPGSVYEIQRVADACADIADPLCYSLPLIVETQTYGDVWPIWDWEMIVPQPDFGDIAAIVQKFLAAGPATAPSKKTCQLQPNAVFPARSIDFRDIAADVEAFLGTPYSSAEAGPCACPSEVTCGATPCTSALPCGGGLCVSGFCADSCGRCTP